MNMRSAIYGAGSLGTILGAFITKNGGQVDLIKLDNAAVVTMLKGFLAPDGVIVTLQNGLPELLISEIVGEGRVLGCTVAWGATMLGPGVCELTSSPDSLTFSLGAVSKEVNGHFAEVKALLEMMGPVEVEENFIGTRWTP